MEYTDWSPQSIITLVAGVLATIALIAATAYAFTKVGTVNKKGADRSSVIAVRNDVQVAGPLSGAERGKGCDADARGSGGCRLGARAVKACGWPTVGSRPLSE